MFMGYVSLPEGNIDLHLTVHGGQPVILHDGDDHKLYRLIYTKVHIDTAIWVLNQKYCYPKMDGENNGKPY